MQRPYATGCEAQNLSPITQTSTPPHLLRLNCTMTKLGIVCGLLFEVAILERAIRNLNPGPAPLVMCSGPGLVRARETTVRLAKQGADALMSFGIAGGLDPSLKTGAVVVVTGVTGGSVPPCDATWAARLYEAFNKGFDVRRAPLAMAQDVLATPADKAAAFRASAAAATDMESYGIADAAAVKGIPFAALRVVCDTADETIPPAATAAMADDGRVRTITTILKTLAHPTQIPDLVRLGRHTAQARSVLEKLAGLGVPRLFFASR